jgi:hypothetical protein
MGCRLISAVNTTLVVAVDVTAVDVELVHFSKVWSVAVDLIFVLLSFSFYGSVSVSLDYGQVVLNQFLLMSVYKQDLTCAAIIISIRSYFTQLSLSPERNFPLALLYSPTPSH